jgi:hypothetical protein
MVMIRAGRLSMKKMIEAIVFTVAALLTVNGWSRGIAATPGTNQEMDITAEQVIEKSIEATGGREAAERITNNVAQGTLELAPQGVTASLEVYAKAPNKRLVITRIEDFGEVRQGFDGQVAWAENPMQGTVELEGEALAIARRNSTFYADLKWRELYQKAELKGKEQLGDREVYVVELTPAEGKPVTRYYDAETFLLLRTDMVQPTPEGLVEVQIRLSDYRDHEGLKVPFLITQSLPSGEVVVKITGLKSNVEIEDTKFAKPEATAH